MKVFKDEPKNTDVCRKLHNSFFILTKEKQYYIVDFVEGLVHT
jgi:hypothetical protein